MYINDTGLISDDSDDDDDIANDFSGEDEEVLNNIQNQFLDHWFKFYDSNAESSVGTNQDESIYKFSDNNYDPRDLVKDIFVEDEFESEHNSENSYFHDYCEVIEIII